MPLQPPPLDATGNVISHDHPEISGNDGVIRRISERQVVVDSAGQRRVSSIAFKASSGANGGMSVDLEELINGVVRFWTNCGDSPQYPDGHAPTA